MNPIASGQWPLKGLTPFPPPRKPCLVAGTAVIFELRHLSSALSSVRVQQLQEAKYYMILPALPWLRLVELTEPQSQQHRRGGALSALPYLPLPFHFVHSA